MSMDGAWLRILEELFLPFFTTSLVVGGAGNRWKMSLLIVANYVSNFGIKDRHLKIGSGSFAATSENHS